MNILVLNGPNLNMLGIREPEIYGTDSYDDLTVMIKAHCQTKNIGGEIFQSNHEGVLIDLIQEARGKFDGIVINPAAYAHTSIALLDTLKAVAIPTVEVHISDPDSREDFRRTAYLRSACIATIKGQGFGGYLSAIDLLIDYLQQ